MCVQSSVRLIDLITHNHVIINALKSDLNQYSVEALGYVQDGGGTSIHPSKISAIVKWRPPTNGVEIKRFMGTVNFPRDHLKHIALIGAPLDRLPAAKSIIWNVELEKSIQRVKDLLIRSLKMVQVSRLFIGTRDN